MESNAAKTMWLSSNLNTSGCTCPGRNAAASVLKTSSPCKPCQAKSKESVVSIKNDPVKTEQIMRDVLKEFLGKFHLAAEQNDRGQFFYQYDLRS